MVEKKRNAIFFLGAGASAHAGIPTVVPMTEEFQAHVMQNYKKCDRVLRSVISGLKKSGKHDSPDIEAILRTVHRLIDHENDEISQFLKDGHRLEQTELIALKDILQTFIRNKVLRPTDVSYLAPLLDAVWGGPVDIFSVNYDPCIELLCRNLQRRLVDGFVPEWNPQALETEDPSAVCLYKLHGSALWFQSDAGWPIKIPIGPSKDSNSSLELFDGSKVEPIMLYPMHKQPVEAPLLDFTYILKQRLESASFLIVIGYSFRDEYLSALIRDAFNSNPELHMVSIGPDARSHYKDLLAKPPSYRRAFEGRITCVPFAVERILSKVTAGFVGYAAAVKQYREDSSVARTGRDVNLGRHIEPLSKYGEVALSNSLIDWPVTEPNHEADLLWSVTVRNFCNALVLRDADLIESTLNHLQECLGMIRDRLHFMLSCSGDRWSVRCEMRRTSSGGGYAPQDFNQLQWRSSQLIAEVDAIRRDLISSQRNVRDALNDIRNELYRTHKLFENLSGLSGRSLDDLRAVIRPQLLESQQRYDAWSIKVENASQSSQAFESELKEICTSVLPKAFSDLWDVCEKHKEAIVGKSASRGAAA